MISLAVALSGALFYIIGAEINGHDAEPDSHPNIQAQIQAHDDTLKRIEAGQIRETIMSLDDRICADPDNRVYRQELARLIAAWEKLTGQSFPRELLRCA